MKLSLVSFLGAIGATSAASLKKNPFAPKVTPASDAAAKYSSKMMSGAKTLRALEENEVDLTNYSIKFEKCQFVKEFAGEEGGGGGQDGGQFLFTKRFVIFRLCPSNSCTSCSYNYGEYLIDLETYLQVTTEYVQELQQQNCEICNQCYENQYNNNNNNNGDNNNNNNEDAWNCNGIDTSTCYTECQNIENMEENGYVDATEFLECQRLEQDENGQVEYNQYGEQIEYYAGPVCANNGMRIKIGVFYDEQCSNIVEDKDIESMMKRNDNGYSMSLSYHALKATFPEGDCVASCKQVDEDQNNNNQNQNNNGDGNWNYQQAETAEICRNLYEAAGKCESKHGFEKAMANNYYYQNNNQDNNNQNGGYNWYENQIKNEDAVCNYMDNVMSGIFDMTGEIQINGGRTVTGGGSATTGGQKFALTFFILGSIGLAGYAAMLHQQLTKGSKAALAQQGGSMA